MNSQLRKATALVCLVLHLFSLGVGIFSSTVALANDIKHSATSSDHHQLDYDHTRPYILKQGETVATVAKHYNISVQDLARLNLFRKFKKPFSQLSAGDELDVPLAPLTVGVVAQNKQQDVRRKIASVSAQVGQELNDNSASKAAERVASNIASSEAGQVIQSWLSQFGTARVRLSVDPDNHYSLTDSEIDLLFPLWQQPSDLLFTQESLHRTDDRTQSNIGLGWRHFFPNSMFGINTFWDQDWSHHHTRGSIGLEYWRDYIKLSANDYIRLSDWRDSPNLIDYQERPASGWDLRADAYLPAYPQLGAKLIYEQYYGDQVALLDRDHREKNPRAYTVGLNYTPFPLLTLNLDERKAGSQKETQLSADINYQLDKSLDEQLDSDSVKALRSLAGSRYDLVDRNNDIILEYRKKDSITLQLKPEIDGYPGNKISLGVAVTPINEFDHIEWDAVSLLANGGQISHDGGTHYSVILPSYQSGSKVINDYIIGGIAFDTKGNHSERAVSHIVVFQPVPDADKSSFSLNPSNIKADGVTTSTLTFVAKDANGAPIINESNDVSFVVKDSKGNKPADNKIKISQVSESAPGTYTAKLSGTLADTFTVNPEFYATPVGSLSKQITLTAGDTPDVSHSNFSANPKSIAADGKATSTLTFVAFDAFDNPISGQAANIVFKVKDSQGGSPDPAKVVVGNIKESAAGTYTATLSGTLADSYTITPQFNGSDVGSLSDQVTLTAGETPDAGHSSFSANPKSIAADGQATSTLTFVAHDNFDNPIVGKASAITLLVKDSKGGTPATDKVIISSVTESTTAGTYTATLSGTLADSYTIRPQFNGSAVGNLNAQVALTAGETPDADHSSFSADPKSIVADGQATSTLTFVAHDNFDNPIAGKATAITLQVKDSKGSIPASDKVIISSVTESSTDGTYTATLSGTLADSYTITPQFNGSAVGNLNAQVALTAGETPDADHSSFSADPKSIAADGQATSTLTFVAHDVFDNVISGQAANIVFKVKDSQGGSPDPAKVVVGTIKESAAGTYTATLSGTLADSYTITPQFNGSAVGTLADQVALTAGETPDADHSSFSANPKSIAADGKTLSTLTFVARDNFDNPIVGKASAITLLVKDSKGGTPASDKVTISSVTESSTDGTYTATLSGTLADSYTITPQFNGSAVGNLNAQVALTAGETPDAVHSSFSANPKSIAADGKTLSTLTFVAHDNFDNPIAGKATAITLLVKDSKGGAPASDKVTISSVTESTTAGTYTATLSGTLADSYTITPQFNGTAVGNLNAQVALTAGETPDADHSSFSADPKSIAADGKTLSTLTFVAHDNFDNPIVGKASAITLLVKDSKGSIPASDKVTISSVTESTTAGTYTATLSGTLADSYTISPQFNGTAVGNLNAQVALTAGETPDADHSSFSADPKSIAADGQATSTLTFVAHDVFDNIISGQAANIVFKVKDSQGNNPDPAKVVVGTIKESAAGTYTAALSGTLADSYTITPQFNGTAVGNLNAQVALTAGETPDADHSNFSADPKSIAADGKTTSTLTFVAHDVFDNAISGQAANIVFKVKDSQGNNPDPAKVVVGTIKESAAGTYTATLSGTLADSYTITPQFNGTAVGNLNAQVALTAGDTPDADHSSFSANPKSIAADGKTLSTLTFVAHDNFDNPIVGKASAITLLVKDSKGGTPASDKVTISNVTESTTAGTYTATLSGTLADSYTITPQFNGTAVGNLNAQVALTAGETPDADHSSFSANPKSIAADGKATSTLTFVAHDNFDNPIVGKASAITLLVKDSKGGTPASDKVTISSVTESTTAGTYTATLSGTLADSYTITPQFNGTAVGNLNAQVALTAGETPDADHSSFSADPKSIAADGQATSTLTFVAHDVFDNIISGQAANIVFKVKDSQGNNPDPAKVVVGTIKESAAGTYTATLSGTLADSYTITPQFNGTAVGNLNAQVALTAGETPDADHSSFSANPKSIAADGKTLSTLTFVAHDNFDNPIVGKASAITLQVKDSKGGTPASDKVIISSVTESSSAGTYTATLSGTLADSYTISPQFNGTAVGNLNAQVALTAGDTPDAGYSSFSADPKSIAADGQATSTLTFVARDAFDNPISGQAAALGIKITDSQGGTPAADRVKVTAIAESGTVGTYTATLSGTLADSYTISPQFNGSDIGSLSAQVILTAGDTPDAVHSSFSADPKSIVADGKTTSTLTFVARDAFDNPISGQAAALGIKITDSQGGKPAADRVKVTAITESGTAGTYTATLSGTLADSYTISPQFNGSDIGSLNAQVILTAGETPDAVHSSFSADPKSIAADGKATSTLTFVAHDNFDNPIAGKASAITLLVKDSKGGTPASDKVIISSVTESSTDGTYTATLSGTLADSYTISPQFNGTAVGNLNAQVALTAGETPDAGHSSFSGNPKSIAADGQATSTLTFVARDVFDNPISGQAAALGIKITDSQGGTPAADRVKVTAITESGTAGTYTATLSGTLADSYTITPQFNGTAVGNLNAQVALTAGETPDADHSNFSANPKSIAADGQATSTLTFVARDAFDNPISGQAAALGIKITDSQGGTPAADRVKVTAIAESGTVGTYTATLSGTLADSYTISPQFNGSDIGSLSAQVILTAGATPDAVHSSFSADPKSIAADGKTLSTLTFVAHDNFDNPIVGKASAITLLVKDSKGGTPASDKVIISSVTESSSAGTYTATLSGTLADSYTISPQFNGSAVGTLADQVALTAGDTPDADHSSFSADPKSIAADGKATSTLTFVIHDNFDNPIHGKASLINMVVTDSKGGKPASDKVIVSNVTESIADGTYTATLSGTLADSYTITPQFNGTAVGNLNAQVALTAGETPDAGYSSFSADPKSIAADGKATSTLTFVAHDNFDNPIAGKASAITLLVKDSKGGTPASDKVIISSVTESSSAGTYTATLSGTLADSYTISPQFNGTAVGNLNAQVALTASETPDADHSSFSADPKSIAADGQATSTLTFVIHDNFDNPIHGKASLINMVVTDSKGGKPASDKVIVSNVIESTADGTYTATLRGTLADRYTITPQFNGSTVGKLSDQVTLTAGETPDAGHSSFSADPKSIVADGKTLSTLTFAAHDNFDNPIVGKASAITLLVKDSKGGTPASDKVSISSVTESSSAGIYTATLSGTLADSYTISPQFNGTAVGNLNAQVALTAGETPDADHSSFSADPKSIAADGQATSTLTFVIHDNFDNPIHGKASLINMVVTDSKGGKPASDKVIVSNVIESTADGTYTATLRGTLADRYTITPQFNGSTVGKLSDQVTLTAGETPDAGHSSFSADPKSIVADGKATSTLTFIAHDNFDNPIHGKATAITLLVTDSKGGKPASDKVIVSSVTESSTDGTYTASISGILADSYTITPQFNGSAVGTLIDTVTLTATAPDDKHSTFSADPKTIAADGQASSTLTFVARDSFDNPVTGQSANIVFTVKDSQGTTPDLEKVVVSTISESTAGTYTATLNGTLAGRYTLTPQFNSSAVGTLSDTVTLTAGTPDGKLSTFNADPKTIVADGQASSTLTFVARDSFDNPVTGQSANIVFAVKDSQGTTPDPKKVVVSTISESTAGTYTVTLSGTLAGSYTITPQFNGSAVGTLADQVTLTAGDTPDAGHSTFRADPKSIVADGVANSTVTFVARDSFDNLVSGKASAITLVVTDGQGGTPAKGKLNISRFTESVAGTYTASISGTLAGSYTITPQFNGSAVGTLIDTVTLTAAAPDDKHSTFSADPKTIAADGQASSTLTFVARDSFDNPVTGQSANIVFAVKDSQGTTPDLEKVVVSTISESTAGTYTATLNGTLAGRYTLTPQFNSSAVGTLSDTVTLTAGTPDGKLSTFNADPKMIAADGQASSTLTFVARDSFDNPVTGQSANIVFAVKDSQGTTPDPKKVVVSTISESTAGTYTVTLSGTLAGSYTISPQFTGSAVGSLKDMVTLNAGDTPDAEHSTFSADPKRIISDGKAQSTLTFIARDRFDNAISGKASAITLVVTDSKGGKPATDKVMMTSVTETSTPGTYTAMLSGVLADTYTITPQFNGSTVSNLSAQVVLSEPDKLTSIAVNGAKFPITDGFPRTGFIGAKFQFLINGTTTNNSNYDWKIDQSWASIDATGSVIFNSTPTSGAKSVRVTAISKIGEPSLTYNFKINSWFINSGDNMINRDNATNFCAGQGYYVPNYRQLTNATEANVGTRNGNTANLWAEWGDLSVFLNGWHGYIYWAWENKDSTNGYTVYMNNGRLDYFNRYSSVYAVCMKTL